MTLDLDGIQLYKKVLKEPSEPWTIVFSLRR